MALPPFELPRYDSSLNSRVSMTLAGPRDPVHAMQLSPDGKFLVLGNDGGSLEIRNTEPGWERIRVYEERTNIRAVSWHPSEERTLFIGCGNGNIHRLSFQLKGDDRIASGQVNGFVHALAMNAESNQLAVAFANSIAVIDKPFSVADELGALKYLRMPALEVEKDTSTANTITYTLPRNLYYLSAEVLLAVFFGDIGIIAYSTNSGEQLWKMDIMSPWAGSAALSPSGEYLAVADLMHGVDWYSLSHRRFMMTTSFASTEESYKHNMVIGLAFLNENIAVVGHNCGKIIFCPFGLAQNPPVLRVGNGSQDLLAIQTLCCGVVNGAMRVLVMVPIDEEDEQQSSAPQIAIVRFQNESMLAKLGKGGSKKAADLRGNKSSIAIGRPILALIMVVLAGIWQYWPQAPTTFTSRQPGRTEHLQLSHELCTRQPIRLSTITKTQTVIETTTATETTTAMEMTTATETNIVKETSTATETTFIEMVPASPDCVCTISTILNVGERIGEEMDEEEI